MIGHAEDLNISVFESVEAARRGRWKRPRDRRSSPRDPVAQLALADEVHRQREAALLTPEQWRRRQIMRWIAFGGVLAVLLAAVYVILPSATVTLTPASDQVFVRVPVVADPTLTDLDIPNGRMPASVITLPATARVTVQTSERETVGASQAQGTVIFRKYRAAGLHPARHGRCDGWHVPGAL